MSVRTLPNRPNGSQIMREHQQIPKGEALQNKWPACFKYGKVLKDKKIEELFQMNETKGIRQVIATCDPGLALDPGNKKSVTKNIGEGKRGRNISWQVVSIE